MLKRLRSAHPMLYCLVAEVLFLGMLFVASLLSLLLILFVVRDIDAVDDYMLTFMQEAAGVLVAWLFLARTGKSVFHRTMEFLGRDQRHHGLTAGRVKFCAG